MSEAAKGHLAMLLFSALVAGSFSLGVLAANQIAPVALNTIRFVIAAVLVGGALALGGRMRRADYRAAWRYLILGSVFASYFVLMFEGLKTAPPVSAAAVFTLMPLMAAGFGWLLLRQVASGWMLSALMIGAAGALWVIFGGDLSALMRFEVGRGEAIYFVGCIMHALYVPLVRMLNRGEGAVPFTFGTLVAGALAMTLWGWRDIAATDWTALAPIVWVTIAYVSVFATAITFVLVQYGSLRLPSGKVMAYSYLTPTWVIAWELALGHGGPPGIVLVGIALTVVALTMLLANR